MRGKATACAKIASDSTPDHARKRAGPDACSHEKNGIIGRHARLSHRGDVPGGYATDNPEETNCPEDINCRSRVAPAGPFTASRHVASATR